MGERVGDLAGVRVLPRLRVDARERFRVLRCCIAYVHEAHAPTLDGSADVPLPVHGDPACFTTSDDPAAGYGAAMPSAQGPYLAVEYEVHGAGERGTVFFGTSGDLGYLNNLMRSKGFAAEVVAHDELTRDGVTVDYFTFRVA